MTSTTKHSKHAKMARPEFGQFSRLELGILGTPCSNIKKLAYAVIEALSARHAIAYVDADHKSADQAQEAGKDTNSALAYGSSLEFTDKITFSRFDYTRSLNPFQLRPLFNNQALVLVNGNHFPALAQILVIDPAKPLEKKLDKLTNVKLLLLKEGAQLPEYLQQHLPHWQELTTYNLEDTAAIAQWVEEYIQANFPPLYGLVLTGGQSTRMQQDKASLNYHGKQQKEHVAALLSTYCEKVYLSTRSSTAEETLPQIEDKFIGLGPMGGILSAFQQHPEAAWLVVACDLPYLGTATLDTLVKQRNAGKAATAFIGDQEFPEPLITIWEPRSYATLLQFVGYGYSCPRKVLINSDIQLLQAPDKEELQNINTPEEYKEALSRLRLK